MTIKSQRLFFEAVSDNCLDVLHETETSLAFGAGGRKVKEEVNDSQDVFILRSPLLINFMS